MYSSVKTNFLVALGILTVFLNFGPSAEARNGGGGWYQPPPPVDTRILVDRVDISNQQITLIFERDHTKHVYLVDMTTIIKFQGNTGTINDLNVGQLVASYVERDSASLDSIEIATTPKSHADNTEAPEVAAIKPSPPVNPAPSVNPAPPKSPSSPPANTTSAFGSPTPPQNVNPPQPSPSSSPDNTASPFGSLAPTQNVNPSPSGDNRILVEGVDVPAQQITLINESDHTKHVYLVDPATVITVEGNTGTIKSISIGQQVASYVERDFTTLVSIKIVSP
jgi:hypothetical protein